MMYRVRYQVATYHGERVVDAESASHAIAKVKRWVWAQQPPAMSYEHYEASLVTDSD